MFAKSMKGEDIARKLIHLLTEYDISSSHLVAAIHNRASVNDNDVAMRRIAKVIYPNLLDGGCFSHTLDLVDNHFHVPTLSEFGILLLTHRPKVRMLWKEYTASSVLSSSPTPWWSRLKVYKQMMVQFGDLEDFLKSNSDVSPATRTKCCFILLISQKKLTCKWN